MSKQPAPATQTCSACGGTDKLRPHSPWHGPHVICNYCFMVWFDDAITDAAELGRESLRRKAAGEFPYKSALAALGAPR